MADPAKGTKMDASIVAKSFRNEIKAKVVAMKQAGIEPPLLVGLLANKDPAARKYAEWTGKACRADGLRYELRTLDDPIEVEAALIDANDDPRVHGIIVYYPIFGQEESFSGESQDDYLRDTISHKCDVEGLCHSYRTNLYRNVRFLDYPTNNQKCLLPCTALSVVKIIESCPGCYDFTKPVGRKLEGKTVTVINRSEIVGRPLAAMLANDGADVYSVDINSIYMFRDGRLHACDDSVTPESCVRKSSIVVTGVPTKNYKLPTEWVKPNTTVINVASFKNVEEEELLQIPGVVYVSQVGKVTVAMLERNLMRLYEQFHARNNKTDAIAGASSDKNSNNERQSIWSVRLQAYSAAVLTVILAMQLLKK
ncbi:NAD(P)-binding protein [Fragilariopsis cylindrus CCMP1102]|uniref:NAD(P)-binding protein n=1 Tax=Fragilariopsis cylindrus CCMP1102 TaxID=635003 RepID=A0A1E7EQZ2_9STRA|nr:NAD(P)-binding protein [Fragilariopsis cylindrus CCMP1102]|eukprot:OEU08341.1 NAD(P)-binding protein [Fragilariopsis cylindrus CCMP1102]